MIAAVTLAEKNERKRVHTILKWMKADAEVRDEGHLEVDYQELHLIAPAKGNQRFAHCQMLYEDVHGCLKERKWAPAQADTEVAGITWIELFVLFDITGSRSEKGQHQKNPAATRRAKKRRENAKDAKNKKRNISETMAVAKPTLDEEIKLFKAIVRHITKFEIEPKEARWFIADNRPCLKRLGNLGINGHQPSITVYCKMAREEKQKVTDAIMKQKTQTIRKPNCSLLNIGEGKRKTKKPRSSSA